MAQPSPYIRFQNHSDYQAGHQLPGPALSGVALDTDFDRIKSTLDQILANLALVQRDDGGLRNASVSPDTITSALAIMIANWTIRGAWLTGTNYALKDYVTQGGSGYVCVVAHTSGVFATDLAAGGWVLVSTKGDTGPTGAAGVNGTNGAPAFKNRFINGDFAIDQRRGGGSFGTVAGAAPVYSVDRWMVSSTGSASLLWQRVAGTSPTPFALRLTGQTGVTGGMVGQRIESKDCVELVNQPVVVSINLKSTSLTSVTWTAYRANAADNWAAKTQIDTGTLTGISSTLSSKSFTFNAGANAANGIAIEFTFGALTAGNTIHFENAQLETGTTPTLFERVETISSLQRCKRFYRQSGPVLGVVGVNGLVGPAIYVDGSFISPYVENFDIEMRATPTIVLYDGAGTSGASSVISLAGGTSYTHGASAATAFDIGARGFKLTPFAADFNYFNHYSATAEL